MIEDGSIGSAEPPSQERVSSPAATGGAGNLFEQHVGAFWLGLLLVRAIPPVFLRSSLERVHFQTQHLGWKTDDFLIIAQDPTGSERKLAGQVRRGFTISSTDKNSKETVERLWLDFTDSDRFTPDSDALALVVQRGTASLLADLAALLDCARAARDGRAFARRLAVPGLLSRKAIRHCDVIREVVSGVEGRSCDPADIWPFLRVLHVLHLDLAGPVAQAEASIKTLLAHTTVVDDPVLVADSSWNALVAEAGRGMTAAGDYRRGDLPEGLRALHSPIGSPEQRVLQALDEHSKPIVKGIRAFIGAELHLPRERLVQRVLESLESRRVTVIAGVAGSGKSGVAKTVLQSIGDHRMVVAFRGEAFAQSHIDKTLHSIGIGAGGATLAAVLAGQDRKVLLVESVERLLEHSTRDAFADLLTLVREDPSWSLMLTCREHAVEVVRSAFLRHARLNDVVVSIPPLDESEMQLVEEAYPSLAQPLSNPTVRRLLSNPYLLDRATEFEWSTIDSMPQTEQEFRGLYWREIVRARNHATPGMAGRREVTLQRIALRRARSLTPYVECADVDADAIESLRADSLLVTSPAVEALVAPAHDVIEDWAILRWLDVECSTQGIRMQRTAQKVSGHPAVRRGYRKWVAEHVAVHPALGDDLLNAALVEPELPSHFRDDTLLSLMRSRDAAALLDRHQSELVAGDSPSLLRVIHLLRVGSVTTATWPQPHAALAHSYSLPDGPAWPEVLRMLQTHVTVFLPEHFVAVQGFVEHWSRGVSNENPYPPGASAAAAISFALLDSLPPYGSKDVRTKILEVIAKIPGESRDRVAALLAPSEDPDGRLDETTDSFREIVLGGLGGAALARDLPDVLIPAIKASLLIGDANVGRERKPAHALALEPMFGISSVWSYEQPVASALRGAFLPVLRHHPRRALALLIEVLNRSADWYGNRRVSKDSLESAFRVTLAFADGSTARQWCNPQLWNLYRGTSVGPYILQSLLMALEHWLLEVADTWPNDLDRILLNVLRESTSGATTAVVASVATAFPEHAGEALLVLLSSPHSVRLDRQRLGSEMHVSHGVTGTAPWLSEQPVYRDERMAANGRPHRKSDIQDAVFTLQFGPLRSRVEALLDKHRAALPPEASQDDTHREWRIALHRMDARQYEVADSGSAPTPPPQEGAIYLVPQEPADDLREMIATSEQQVRPLQENAALFLWGQKSVAGHDTGDEWRSKLRSARDLKTRKGTGKASRLMANGIGWVAAACILRRWKDMTEDERHWCVDVVCDAIESEANHWEEIAMMQKNEMAADRVGASTVPVLAGKDLPRRAHKRVRRSMALALTHAVAEVRTSIASGIAAHLWSIDAELARRCVNAVATDANVKQREYNRGTPAHAGSSRRYTEIIRRAAVTVRRRFARRSGIPADAFENLALDSWFSLEAYKFGLHVYLGRPDDPAAVGAFSRSTQTIVRQWATRPGSQGDDKWTMSRDYYKLPSLIQQFLLRTPLSAATQVVRPVADSVNRHPSECAWWLLGLVGCEDRDSNSEQFWILWDLFAKRVRSASWLGQIDDRYARGREMISAVFLGNYWKEGVEHWKSLEEGHAERVHRLFRDLPVSRQVLDCYASFLYRVGRRSLPGAFVYVAEKLRGPQAKELMSTHTVLCLEILLRPYVSGRPQQTKARTTLRKAVLLLLDLLVECGSSSAFQMRDDFVTPIAN